MEAFYSKHNDSLADIEKHMQSVMPPMSPVTGSVSDRRKPNSFIRGPSSFELLKQAKNQTITSAKPKKKKILSKCGIMFLVLALLQALVISGLQITINVLADFNGGRLEEYVECVAKEFNATNRTLPENSTFPSFGTDKQVYIVIFIFLAVYNFSLCLYALLAQRIVEVGSFVINNFLLLIYASVQVYQFRGFGEFCDPITRVGWLALGNVFAVFMFNVMFCFLAIQIYVEFGWKVYKFVNCNPALRFYYRNYEIFLSIVKAIIVFTIVFLVGQAALILKLNDYEFWLTFPFIGGMILLYLYAFFMVRRESHIAFLCLLLIGLLLTGYFCFKVYRYATRSCPVCTQINEEISDRREDFQHLTMMGSLNIVISIGYLLSLIRVWTQFGKGLADHFYIHGYWFDRILRKKPVEAAFLNSAVGTGKMMKQRSTALLLNIKPLNLESHDMKRNSSLDEKDYADYIFTPTTEFKSLALASPSGSSNGDDDMKPMNSDRKYSLPIILETK